MLNLALGALMALPLIAVAEIRVRTARREHINDVLQLRAAAEGRPKHRLGLNRNAA